MPERLIDPPSTERIPFAALSAILVAVLALSALGLSFAIRTLDRDAIVDRLDLAERLFEARLTSDVEKMAIALGGIAQLPEVAGFLESGQRDALFETMWPRFEHLRDRHGITHLYFTRPDGTVLLRAHQPDRFDDRIDRQSQREAERSGRTSSGIEIGMLGTMTLRIVTPWHGDEGLRGYLEAGAEVATLVDSISPPAGVTYAVFAAKDALSRVSDAAVGDIAGWDRYRSSYEITAGGSIELPAEVVDAHPEGRSRAGALEIVETGSGERALRWIPLLDPKGREVGCLVVALDLAVGQRLAERYAVALALGVAALGGGLLLLLWRIRQRARLETRRAREATERAFADLERQVEERTAALRAANESLGSSEAQLRIITDSLPVLITYIGADLKYRFLNRTARRWLAVPEGEGVGRDLTSIIRPHAYRAFARYVEAVLAGERQDFEVTVVYPDGVERSVHLSYIPELDESGRVLGFFSLAEDITERRATERQLRNAQKMEAVGQLTGGIAHDFNNLLAIIQGNAELLAERLTGRADEARMAQTVVGASERGARLCQQLLAFARKQPLRAVSLQVDGLIRGMEGLLRRSLREDIALELHCEPGLWTCRADPTWLEQALLNLVINARDAMPGGGELRIEARNLAVAPSCGGEDDDLAPGDYVALSVSDSGGGIPAEVRERIFEPFFSTKTEGRGSGLGLSMVYGFAQQSNGHIAVTSVEGEGSTFRLCLPRGEAVCDPAKPESEPASGSDGGETVLVVEDEPEVRALAVTILSNLGYRVFEAATGEEALAIFPEIPQVDLLLSDVVLPSGLSGPDTAQRLCREQPDLRVLYMSGYAKETVLKGKALDRDTALIAKPFRKDELARRVREVLDQSLSPPPATRPW